MTANLFNMQYNIPDIADISRGLSHDSPLYPKEFCPCGIAVLMFQLQNDFSTII